MAGFGVPSAWGHATPGRAPGGKPATSSIWGRPATRSGGLGGFTLPSPQPGMGGLSGPQTAQAAPGQVVHPATSPSASAAPAASPPSSPVSPLDSTYYGNIAANDFKVGNAINSLNRTDQNNYTALQDVLGRLAYQQPRDQLKLEQNANRTGGLYSSVEAQNQGNLLNSYQTRQSEANRGYSEKHSGIVSAIAALRQGIPIYDDQQYDAAVGRSGKAAASNPATGQDAGSTPSIPSASGPNLGYGATVTPGGARSGGRVNWGLLRKPPSMGRQPATPNFGLLRRPGGGF